MLDNDHYYAVWEKKRKRRELVASLFAQQLSMVQVCERTGLTLDIVRREKRAIDMAWLRKVKDNLDVDKARQLARIDALEKQYRKAYELSCQPKKRKRHLKKTRMKKVSDSESVEVSDGGEKIVETETRSSGDVRFLQGIEWCIAEWNKLQGHYPKETAPSGGMPMITIVGPQQVNIVPPPLPIPQPPPLPIPLENLLPPAFSFNDPDVQNSIVTDIPPDEPSIDRIPV